MKRQFTSIAQAEEFLLKFAPMSMLETYTLERMKALMNRLGDPQDKVSVIHVAGTSGKTSTAYYIRALLQVHGKKTGLTASPHIHSVTERVQVDGRPLKDEVFIGYLNEFISIISQWNDLTFSYFELLSAFSFWVFEKEQVDYAVIEVGLGGLLDATNVITRSSKVSVITPIGLDHTEVLGNTIEEIANQKAGIILPHSVVVMSHQVSQVERVIERVATQTASHLITVKKCQQYSSVIPPFQQDNFESAKSALNYLIERDGLTPASKDVAAECIYDTPPGRFELYTVGSTRVILDGAHNPQKLAALQEALKQDGASSYTWLIGLKHASNTKIADCLATVYRPNDKYYFTNFTIGQGVGGRKSVDAHKLARYAANWEVAKHVVDDPVDALNHVIHEQKQRTVVVTGSLYLIAGVREHVRQLAELVA